MSPPLPLACTVDEAGRSQRSAEITALVADSLRTIERGERSTALHFRSTPEVRRRLDDLAARESECCAFLELEISEVGPSITLRVSAPADGEATIDRLVELVGWSAPTDERDRSRAS